MSAVHWARSQYQPFSKRAFKSCYLSGLNTERKLRYFHPTKAATVRHPVPQRLSHQVGFQFKSFKSNLHALDNIKTYEGIKKTVDTHKICSSPGHPNSTLPHRYSRLVPTWPHAHGCPHGEAVLQSYLYGPLHLQDITEILADDELYVVLDKNLKSRS